MFLVSPCPPLVSRARRTFAPSELGFAMQAQQMLFPFQPSLVAKAGGIYVFRSRAEDAFQCPLDRFNWQDASLAYRVPELCAGDILYEKYIKSKGSPETVRW